MPTPQAGDLYQHYKGGLYRIETLATIEADESPAVVYVPLGAHDGSRWVRPIAAFIETIVDPHGGERPRFARVEMPDDRALRHYVHKPRGLSARLVDAVLARHAEPQRFYHAAWHVQDLFARAAQAEIALTDAQILAILFHDAVYVPGAAAGMNEAMSALLLRQWAQASPPADIEAACRLIEDTATHEPGSLQSEQVIALDLDSLADSDVNFDAYTEMAWLEYRHLFVQEPHPKARFLQRRHELLAGLAATADQLRMLPGFHAAFAANLERMRSRLAFLH